MKKIVVILLMTLAIVLGVSAQEQSAPKRMTELQQDSTIAAVVDSAMNAIDSIAGAEGLMVRKHKEPKERRDWSTWRPDTKKAMWLAIVLPGAGQIYNRKYWKIPIVYGGFVGCIYAWRWNGQMYKDYQQAYMDLVDDDPNTKSYEQFLHMGQQITDANKATWERLFKGRKDRYRRWRDLSVFCVLGVYALSIIDAYVDASLSAFDISDDLSMKVAPAYINTRGKALSASTAGPLGSGGLGVRCQLNF